MEKRPLEGAAQRTPGKSWLPWVGATVVVAAAAAATVYFSLRATTAPRPAEAPATAPAPIETLAQPVAPPPTETAPPVAEAAKPPQAVAAQPKPAPAVEAKPEPKPAAPPPGEPAAKAQPEIAAAPVPAAPAPAPAAAEEPKFTVAPPAVAVAQMKPQSTFEDCAGCPTMTVLAPGTFQMGALPADNGNAWEGPSHAVTLAKPFAMARHEVTAAQWRACVEAKACPPVIPGPSTGDFSLVPAVGLNWAEARAYAAWLTQTTGRRYRLPTEAEWEYAVRANTASARYWGGDRTKQCVYGNGADQSALKSDPKLPAVECDDGYATLAPVGSFQANAWGLFDMAGNAWEWTQDCWREGYAGAPVDGSAHESGGCDKRVIRGGSWRARPNSLRSFGRGNNAPGSRGDDLGVRVVAE